MRLVLVTADFSPDMPFVAERPTAPREKASLWRFALVIASAFFHAIALAVLLALPNPAPPPPDTMIPVEVVRHMPEGPGGQTGTPDSKPAEAARPRDTPPPSARGGAEAVTRQPPAPPAQEPTFDGLPAAFRAVTLPPTAIGGTEAASYKAIVFGLLASAKHYPEGARARGAAGVAVVSFAVDPTGAVTRAVLARSSGDPDLDTEALNTVRRSSPFPKPPQGAQTSFAAAIEFGATP